MRLSDLFTKIGSEGSNSGGSMTSFSRSISYLPQSNPLMKRLDSLTEQQSRRLNKLKSSITDSLEVLSLPKSPLFGVHLHKSEKPLLQLNSEPSTKAGLTSIQVIPQVQEQLPFTRSEMTTRSGQFSSSMTSGGSKTRKLTATSNKQQSQYSNWNSLQAQIEDELEQKKPYLINSNSQQSMSTTTARMYDNSHKNNNSISTRNGEKNKQLKLSLKERVDEVNNKFYLQFVSKIGSKSTMAAESKYSQANKPFSSESLSIQSSKELNHHRVLSSMCMAQIKPLKGGKVKKAEKAKFQDYYDNVTDRLREFKQSFTTGEDELYKPKLELNKIKYEPVNIQQSANGTSIEVMRKFYMRDKMQEEHVHIQSMIEGQAMTMGRTGVVQKQMSAEELNQRQKKLESYTNEYKRKTFFLFNKDYGVSGQKQAEEKRRQMKEEDLFDTEAITKDLITSAPEFKMTIQQKQKRIRKDIGELLRRHISLGISLKEAMDEKVFIRKPFKREGAYEFIQYVKSNNVLEVQSMLFKDKYLVHEYDSTLQSPLHWAAKRGYIEMTQLLLKFGAEINVTDEIGRTPLLFAYREGHNEMGKLLLMNKALPWSTKKNPLDAVIHSRLSNDMRTIKIAKQIHLMMKMAKQEQHKKIWEESKYLFEDEKFEKPKK